MHLRVLHCQCRFNNLEPRAQQDRSSLRHSPSSDQSAKAGEPTPTLRERCGGLFHFPTTATLNRETSMSEPEGVVHLILRRINRQTMRLSVPAQYIRDHGLDAGDHCIWIPEADGSVGLKFVKTRELAEPLPQPEA